MKLPRDPKQITTALDMIERADAQNRKKMADVEIARGERLIMTSPDGTRWVLSVSNAGATVWTAL